MINQVKEPTGLPTKEEMINQVKEPTGISGGDD